MTFTNPTTVTAGNKGTAFWGNSVEAAVDELQNVVAYRGFQPAGNTDGSGSPQANWVDMGNLSVPTWATSAIVVLAVTGVQAITAVTSSWLVRARIGTTGPLGDGGLIAFDALSDRRAMTTVEFISTPGSGTQALMVNIERRTGTGSLRADTESRFSAAIFYRG